MSQAAARLPLSGKRIIITRPQAQSAALADLLAGYGAFVISLPCISVSTGSSGPALNEQLSKIAEFDWVILTSVNGVSALREYTSGRPALTAQIAGLKIAAIGAKTAQAINEWLGRAPDVIPEKYVSTQIPDLLGDVDGKQIFLPRADIAGKAIVEELQRRGARTTSVDAYAIEESADPAVVAHFERELAAGAPDLVTFTSPSTVRGFINVLKALNRLQLFDELVHAAIGPVTALELHKFGAQADIVAQPHTVEGLAAGICNFYTK